MGRYLPLLELDVRHAYLDDAPCRSLRFSLDASGDAPLRNAGMIVRSVDGGLQVHYDESRADALRSMIADRGLRLVWRVTSDDQDFLSYTRPGLMVTGHVLYLRSNGDGAERLHAGEHVESGDLVPLSDERLQGILTTRDRALPPLAVLDVHVRDLEPRRHRIHFDAPAIYWKYHLMGKLSEAGHSVIDAAREQAVEFTALGNIALEGGRQAAVFMSAVPIPLRARSTRRFQLRGSGSTSDRVFVPQLPVASVRNVGRDRTGDRERVVSDIYVNC